MFRNINETIEELLSLKGLNKAKEQGNIELVWKKAVGKTIYENTTIKNIKNKVLTIKVKNSVWRNELVFQKKEIIQKLNKNNIRIKEVRFL